MLLSLERVHRVSRALFRLLNVYVKVGIGLSLSSEHLAPNANDEQAMASDLRKGAKSAVAINNV